MVKLRWMEIQGFRSFDKRTTINFPEQGLVLIRGTSGAGKSSILLAIQFALRMCPFATTKLQSWNSEKDLQVDLCLVKDGAEILVQAGKKNAISYGPGETPITSAKAIEEELRKIFATDLETLSAITYRQQGKPGLFLSLTDSGKKEFLTKVLGLDAIEKAVDQAELKIKDLKPRYEQAQALYETTMQAVNRYKEFKEPELQDEDVVLGQKADLDLRAGNIEQEMELIRSKVESAKRHVLKDEEYQRLIETRTAAQAQAQVVSEANELARREFLKGQEVVREKLKAIYQRDTILMQSRKEMERLEKDIIAASNKTCPTCSQEWIDSRSFATAAREKLANLQASCETMSRQQADRISLERESKVQFVHNPQVAQFQNLIALLDSQARERLSFLQQASEVWANSEVSKLQVELAQINGQRQGIAATLASIRRGNEQALRTTMANRAMLVTAEKDEETYRTQSVQLLAELNAERDFVASMGRDGFLGVIFDDVLREIEDEANARLARLTNVGHVTIEFKSEIITGKGSAKRTITPVVHINGHETDLESGLSGGMFTSVEGQVDIAVMTVVQRRTGTMPGWLLLDESFNGQPNDTKEAAIEILKEYAEEKVVVVIDHNSEFKELFTRYIDVDFKEGRSLVK